MRILSFEIHDADGWTLEPLKLDAFNLLVGVSGAGKTRIVRAIERVCAVALGTKESEEEADAARGARFAIDFEHDGLPYRWEAELEAPVFPDTLNGGASLADEPLIRSEQIKQDGHTLVERTSDRFVFKGQPLPLLDRAKSAIAILRQDPTTAPLHTAFSRCVFSALNTMPGYGRNKIAYPYIAGRMLTPGARRAPVEEPAQYGSVDALGADFSLSIHDKAELLQALFPEAFAEVKDAFRDAFPLVEELMVGRVVEREPEVGMVRAYPVLSIQESGVARAVRFAAMSSGMQRYLSFLIHLSYAPRGTVVLIDELEASLGINCLPAATRFLLRRAPDLQLILTSHHPYIIQQIPTACWKLVTRKGSRVRVLDAATIPALEEKRSHLDRFTRLINLPEYEQGIQA